MSATCASAFSTARRRVRGVVMDAEEQVGGVLIALHDLAAQRQIAALLECVAHHDYVHTGALQIALQIFRNRKVDVLLVNTLSTLVAPTSLPP